MKIKKITSLFVIIAILFSCSRTEKIFDILSLNVYADTSNQRDAVVSLALSYQNYVAGTGNSNIFSGWVHGTSTYGEPWCAAFASYCLYNAGVSADKYGGKVKQTSCTFSYWAGDLDRAGLFSYKGNYTPRKGDLIFFDYNLNGTPDHVGIVTDCNGNIVYTVEGNTGISNGAGRVKTKSYYLTYQYIIGYGKVAYQDDVCNCNDSYAGEYIYNGGDYLNIRSGHGTQFKDIGTIPDGAIVRVSKSDGTWAHVTYNGINGYVYLPYMQKYIRHPKLTADQTTVNIVNGSPVYVHIGLSNEPTETYNVDISKNGSGYTAEFTKAWDGSSIELTIQGEGRTEGNGVITLSLRHSSTNTIVSTIDINVNLVVDSYAIWLRSRTYDTGSMMLSNVSKIVIKENGESVQLPKTVPDLLGYNFKGWSNKLEWNVVLDDVVDYLPGDYYSEDNSGYLNSVWTEPYVGVTYPAINHVDITIPDACKYIKFTPLKSGKYVMRGIGDRITFLIHGELYDSSGNKLASNYMGKADNSIGEDGNFFITYNLTAGETYYLRMNVGDKIGNVYPASFDVVIDNAEHTINYDANGGQLAPNNQTKEYAMNIKLSYIEPTRKDYNFIGWSTSATDTEVKYHPGDRYIQDEDITLYAVWEKIPVSPPEIEIKETSNGIILVWGDIYEAKDYDIYIVTDDGMVKIGTTKDTQFLIPSSLKGSCSFGVTASNPEGTSDMSNIEFFEISNPVIGDLNNDGIANNKDIFLMRNILLLENKDSYMNIADLNNDGKINNRDLIILRTIVSKLGI